MSLKSKLNRFKPHISTANSVEKVEVDSHIEIPFIEKWNEAGVSPYFLDNDFCLIRKVKYSLDFQHGKYRLSDYMKAVHLWNNSNINHPLSSKSYEASQLFFFDTETTGLGGGTGNTIFILGHAALIGDEIVLTQHILPKPGSEIPMYDSFLKQVDYQTLVTYNGKSFDWPQVKTRHTLIREHVPRLPEFGHFDLYHAARRMWKHKLDKMKLAVVEKDVLGVKRVDDVPGFLAPMIYFDFVERKDPEGMIKILKHNEIDILSLITLYSHLSFQILGEDNHQTIQEKYEVGKWFFSLGEISSAKKVYLGIDTEGSSVGVQSQYHLGLLSKKQKDFGESLKYFNMVINQQEFPLLRLEACVEASKILEHQHKNYEMAISICDKAIDIINNGCNHKKITMADIQQRKERNIKKNNFLGKRIIHEDSSK